MHVALVYKGPENGQGISVYLDGEHVRDGNERKSYEHQAAPSGVLKIGKLFERTTEARYGKLIMDELFIWNQQLSPTYIQKVIQVAQSTANYSLASSTGR